MASSNRHWPSMFKSKPHHLQHDINSSSSLMSNACRLSPISSVGEERSPEPKPRWNPKPEQIRILEAIFNSGMVNPPRDEIRKIRAQLQEYGQVGDANVFYWFQNRKSRSKHKQRHLQNSKQNPPAATAHDTAAAIAPSSSSSLSSGKSFTNGSDSKTFNIISPTDATSNVIDVSHSPTDSVNQTYFQSPNEYLQDPFFFPAQQQNSGGASVQSLCFNGLINNGVHQIVDNQTLGNFSTLFLGEMIGSGSRQEEEERLKFQQELSFFVANPSPTTIAPTSAVIVPSLPPLQGAGQLTGSKSTVFINDVAFEAPVGRFNVREAFGDDCMLVTPSGYPVLTDEWGVTLHPLQSGAAYYLMRALAAPPFNRPDTTASDLLASEFPYQI